MATIYVTRKIPETGIKLLQDAGHQVDISMKDGVLTKEELLTAVKAKPYDALLSLLTDNIDAEVISATPTIKVVANYAVGYNNIDLEATKSAGVIVTNTPGVLTDTVAEYTVALILTVTKRIAEGDRYVRAGQYEGWAPELLLGNDLKGKTLGILGAGRIGTGVAERMSKAFGMKVLYYDIKPNEYVEKLGAKFKTVDEILRESDVVSIHVPLLGSTKHLIDKERLSLMKPTAYLINTSRGPVVDEAALAKALKEKLLAGAGLDVFEFEPKVDENLLALENVVVTPHIASASVETRNEMSRLAAENIIAALDGQIPPNKVEG